MAPLRGPVDSPATLRGFGSYRMKHPSALVLARPRRKWWPSGLITGDGLQPSTSHPASSATSPRSCG